MADALHRAAIHLLRELSRVDEESGLSAARLSALSVIVYRDGLSLGELAAAERVRPPTMSRLVAALEAAGLVRRQPDPADGRVVRLHATSPGRHLLEAARRRRVARLAADLAALPPRDLAALEEAVALLEQLPGRRPEG